MRSSLFYGVLLFVMLSPVYIRSRSLFTVLVSHISSLFKPRSLLAFVLALLLQPGLTLRGATEPGSNTPPSRRPNVIVLLSDDQRADTIGALGNRAVKTPHLDSLVRGGTSFVRAHIMGGMQGAVCVPSRAMLMSGRSLFRVPENLQGVQTWPSQLQKLGYNTFMTGKWHNTTQAVTRVFEQGRSVFFGGMTDQNQVKVRDFNPNGTFTEERTEKRPSSEIFADEAVHFLRSRTTQTQPFCLYVALTSPHDPRTAPTNFHAQYKAEKIPVPRNFLPEHPFDNGELRVRDELLAPFPRTKERVQKEIADYYAMITHLDDQIGCILSALKESGEESNTIVVFAGDNGLAIGSHGLMGKQNVYEHSMRVPLIFKGPGIPRGKKSDALCYLFDVGATLEDLTGTPHHEGNEGISLMPVLQGRSSEARTELMTAYRLFQRGYTDGRWKLIRYPMVDRVQLFDLKNDPDERVDLSTDPLQQQLLRRLDVALHAQQQVWGDRLFLPAR